MSARRFSRRTPIPGEHTGRLRRLIALVFRHGSLREASRHSGAFGGLSPKAIRQALKEAERDGLLPPSMDYEIADSRHQLAFPLVTKDDFCAALARYGSFQAIAAQTRCPLSVVTKAAQACRLTATERAAAVRCYHAQASHRSYDQSVDTVAM